MLAGDRRALTAALLLLLAPCCGKHALVVRHDASADAQGQDVAEVRTDVPASDQVAAVSDDVASRDAAAADEARTPDAFGTSDTASGDALVVSDGPPRDAPLDRGDAPSDHGADLDSPPSLGPDARSVPPPDGLTSPGDRPHADARPVDVAGPDRADTAPVAPATLCEQTGGTPSTVQCRCPELDFYDRCVSRAGFYCQMGSCDPGSYDVKTCECPTGSCFLPGTGCAGAACTVGADQTCNDNPALSAIRGRCIDGYCVCQGSAFNPSTGKCL